METEIKRQPIHILFFGLIIFLKYLDRWQLVLLFLFLLLVTMVFIPKSKIRHHLYRPADQKYSRGAIAYFVILIILTLAWPVHIVGAALAALALGDGFATLIGKKFNRPKLPWNKDKSLAGSLAFGIATFLGCLLAITWLGPLLPNNQVLAMALVAAVGGAIVESLPLKINDNVTVPLAVALLLSLV
ncbi:MAG: hypothetical protein M0Q93_05940 [Terrimicrobiaceae bacterium]|nr:hypothetical protein [Terrimicrobiaceae bacterium]